jgi:hypothetical protein
MPRSKGLQRTKRTGQNRNPLRIRKFSCNETVNPAGNTCTERREKGTESFLITQTPIPASLPLAFLLKQLRNKSGAEGTGPGICRRGQFRLLYSLQKPPKIILNPSKDTLSLGDIDADP